MVMRPSPTLLLPAQFMAALLPEGGPSKLYFALGSILAQGDQASHFLSSFTCAKSTSGAAAMVADRVTRNSDGCRATITRNASSTTRRPIRMLTSRGFVFICFLLEIVRANIRQTGWHVENNFTPPAFGRTRRTTQQPQQRRQ